MHLLTIETKITAGVLALVLDIPLRSRTVSAVTRPRQSREPAVLKVQTDTATFRWQPVAESNACHGIFAPQPPDHDQEVEIWLELVGD